MEFPEIFERNDLNKTYITDGKHFVIFDDGFIGIGTWHHAVGWMNTSPSGSKAEVKYWYSPGKNKPKKVRKTK